MLTRILTGLVLIAVALAAVRFGGNAFAALAAIAALLMFAEWTAMFRLGRTLQRAGMAVIALAGAVAIVGLITRAPLTPQAVMLLAGGAGLLMLFARRLAPGRGVWLAAGALYCGLPMLALIWLRGTFNGLQLTLWLLVCVWATDIGAYFFGRVIGGPKLAPSISPAKTWAGAVGGVVVAGAAGALALSGSYKHYDWGGTFIISHSHPVKFALLSALLAILAVLGDLFESRLKRIAGVKDSGTILPGHGGVLDRLDGLVPVACVGALIVLAMGWAG